MPGKTTPKNIDAHVLDVLRASTIPLCTLEIQRRLKGNFEVRKIASCVAHLSMKMIIERTGEMTTSKGRYGLYQIAKTPTPAPAYVWQPLKPMRSTVIPVRERGRMAPDVSDGLIVSMVSRVADTRRVER